jgi:hypothetical protein
MAIIPSKLPPWIRTADIVDYGGDVDKQNYLGVDVIDPKTDQSAAQFSSLVQDVVASVNTAPFAVVCGTWTGSEITLHAYRSMYGNGAGYAPTITWNGSYTIFTFTWETEYEDNYGQSSSVVIVGANATSDLAVVPKITYPSVNSVDVYFNSTNSEFRFTLQVWT